MAGIEDKLAKINAIKAEAEAKKTAEKEKTAKESAEKRTGLEQEKVQVEGELALTTEELQKNEAGLAEINAMDLSALDTESRAGIEAEIVGVKEEMDNLRGKIAELTEKKKEIDVELKDVTDETGKISDEKTTEFREEVVAEQAETAEQDSIEMEIQRPLSPEEQKRLDIFFKELKQIQLMPEKTALIHNYNEKIKNLPPQPRGALPNDNDTEWQQTKRLFYEKSKKGLAADLLIDNDPNAGHWQRSQGLEYVPLSERGRLEAAIDFWSNRLGRPGISDEITQKRLEAAEGMLKFLQEERKIKPKKGSELEGLLEKLNDLKEDVGRRLIKESGELRTKIRQDAVLSREKRIDYEKRDLLTKSMSELRKIFGQITQILES
ncbi:MAG TPA: hypothetical protein DEB73_00480 [Candidatus Magasanikbacteria bacterium]|uniref:Uncharacterized protein n=2 Tax=Candidatus Magasanikiibacteriota TaxID=1752731 RepID=A0A0G0ZJC0_9BACT|nr:MAG: hypothetical protein UU49_C0002G0041 [Candidatus Magasanikbacteria bacterium GW2011_GWC2_41_17]KKS13068.1 MAG: hypothetical protein UU69_C0014G0012 [Candidatus Magasanikbacteria bacterium GW2011_GWA2_41_55]HBV57740.1 hypothetical protein [Candidatus Magasanikbacteria bacterium]HBX16378.1 hypothetical protein [Candidatus Magasanikbacteria bacterium]